MPCGGIYLSQHWLIAPEPVYTYHWVLWQSHESNFPGNALYIKLSDAFENYISLNVVSQGSFNNIPALVQIMICRQIGDKPLFEPVLTQFTDACMQH